MGPGLGDVANRLVWRLAASRRASHAAVLLRNQCQMLIGYHFARSPDPAANGEHWLAERVAPRLTTFLDIGANIGRWSEMMLAHSPHARGIAVEPGAAALEQLHERLGGRIETVEAAAGDVDGWAQFVELPSASEWSSLVEHATTNEGLTRSVPMVTVDSLLESLQLDYVDFVKIDAEGYDGRILAGAAGALEGQRLGIVQFEYNRSWALAGSTLGHVLDRLSRAGYQTFSLRPASLGNIDYAWCGEFFSYANFVAVSQKCAGWLL
jgi:FkbM family methyltransferase